MRALPIYFLVVTRHVLRNVHSCRVIIIYLVCMCIYMYIYI